ncbi:uncharacterized protein STEHIDRAFT_121424, partial [Stereum hirsutum FP-91666 SS1]|uniref:uncharacterized protein n=1 Tax=Stereum hirsutum (strain FP-91666) TaxID=721885 RepID=UPI000440D14C
MLLPLAEIPLNVISSDQSVRNGGRRSSGQPLHPRNPNIALSCADLERHDSLLFDSATEEDYNLWSSEEEDQLVFPHHSHLRSSIYDAERVVANEMDGHAYGNTEGLIDTFLGDSAPLINKITDRIYRALVK